MTPILAEIVEVDALWKTTAAAIAAGVGITLAFSLGLLGWTRAHESRLDGRALVTGLWGLLALVGAACVIAALVLGLIIMANK